MLEIQFQSKMNMEKVRETVKKHNCVIMVETNTDTNSGSITVLGDDKDLKQLKDFFSN